MTLEIHKRELLDRVNAEVQSRHLSDVDELIEQALDALNEKTPAPALARDARTGADLIAALQASPYRDLEIEPPRLRLGYVRDVVL
jgi:hypothetical protein